MPDTREHSPASSSDNAAPGRHILKRFRSTAKKSRAADAYLTMTDKEHLKRAGLRGCDANFLDSEQTTTLARYAVRRTGEPLSAGRRDTVACDQSGMVRCAINRSTRSRHGIPADYSLWPCLIPFFVVIVDGFRATAGDPPG